MDGFTYASLAVIGFVCIAALVLRRSYERRFQKYCVPMLRTVLTHPKRLSATIKEAFPEWHASLVGEASDAQLRSAGMELLTRLFRTRMLQLEILGLIVVTGFSGNRDPGLAITPLGREVLAMIDQGLPFKIIWRHIKKRR